MFCQCDKCGNRIRIDGATLGKPAASRQWKQVGKPLETSIDAPWLDNQPPSVQADYDEYERRQPARAASVESDVAVPAFQSLLWGAASLPVTIPLTVVTGWPWWAAPAMSAAVISASWASSMARHSQLLWLIEHVVKKDVNGDGQIGKPEAPPIQLEIDHHHDYGTSKQIIDLPDGVTDGMFSEFVTGILSGASTGESGWIGKRNLFSRTQYTKIRDKLIIGGLAQWVGGAGSSAGWELTPPGKKTLGKHCRLKPPAPESGMTPQSTPAKRV